MAVDNISYLEDQTLVFTLHEGWVQFDADALFAQKPTRATIELDFASTTAANAGTAHNYTNQAGSFDITLTVVSSSSPTANQIKSLSQAISDADCTDLATWMTNVYLPKLKSYAVLEAGYIMTVSGTFVNFVAREYGFGASIYVAAGNALSLPDEGLDAELNENYAAIVRVLREGLPTYVLQSAPTVSDDGVEMDVHAILHALTTPPDSEAPPDYDESLATLLAGRSLVFQLQVGERYGDPVVDQAVATSGDLVCVRGGVLRKDRPAHAGPSAFLGLTAKTLTLAPALEKPTTATAPEFCTVLLDEVDTTYYVIVRLEWSDGETEDVECGNFTTPDDAPTGTKFAYAIPCGLSSLGINPISGENSVVAWSVYVHSAAEFGEDDPYRGPARFVIDDSPSDYERLFLFETRFGGYELLRTVAPAEVAHSVEQTLASGVATTGAAASAHVRRRVVGNKQEIYTQQVGAMDRRWAAYFAEEFLTARRAWVLEPSGWAAVRIETDEIELGPETQGVVEWEFDWQFAR